ncbi:MAG: Mono(2-hydroxyethyl) terephthalate hydrolase [Variovorax sp.]|nr:MAG: Mono(2-hydroxyethyl) terephthalate hydrolase [Variovorax sp.]
MIELATQTGDNMTRNRSIAFALSCALAVLAAGCGGGNGGGGDAAALAAAIAAANAAAAGASGPGSAPPALRAAFKERCSGLVGKTVGPGSIATAEVVAASATTLQTCQVHGAIVSSPTSTINFRIDLPEDSVWNQRLVQIGGGGYDGVVVGPDLVMLANGDVYKRGYAWVSADGGVQVPDLSSTLNNPSAFDNFAFAYHPQVLKVASAAIQSIYGKPAARTYFYGMSTGGREALLQAQRYPQSYDGIVAGEPVVDYSNVIQRGIALAKLAFSNNGAGWLSPAKIKLFGDAQMAACDGLDGAVDGVISHVSACRFDVRTLRCPGGADSGDSCLSDPQIASVDFMRTDFTLPVPVANGITRAPAWGVGGEAAAAGNWTIAQFGASPTAPASQLYFFSDWWLKYQVTSNVNTTVLGYTPGSDPARWLELSEKVNATNPDLSAFAGRGAKLLLWAGASDNLVPPGYATDYYQSVVGKLGQETTDSFMRFYMLPGVVHGPGGPGAGIVDNLAILENWVEKGKAPDDSLTAARLAADGKRVEMTRPLCRYPTWPKYRGAGDQNLAASFSCAYD